MRTFVLLLLLAVACSAQTLRWTAPLPEPSFPAPLGAFFDGCQGDAAGNVAAIVNYQDAGRKVFWFTNLGKPIHADEFLSTAVVQVDIVHVSATILILALYDTGGTMTLRKYTKRFAGVTFADTPFPNHEAFFRPPQLDRVGFFLCEKVSGRPAFLKRFVR